MREGTTANGGAPESLNVNSTDDWPTNPPTPDRGDELRERAEAFEKRYPDQYKPFELLKFSTDGKKLIRDLLAQLDAKEQTIEDNKRYIDEMDSYHCCPMCWSNNVEQTHPAGNGDFGAFKCHECGHQGEIGEDFPSGTALRKKYRDCMHQLASARAVIERLREAMTPSAETKRAYMGEFKFNGPEYSDENMQPRFDTHLVPWITIKEIMKAITDRAALDASGGSDE